MSDRPFNGMSDEQILECGDPLLLSRLTALALKRAMERWDKHKLYFAGIGIALSAMASILTAHCLK